MTTQLIRLVCPQCEQQSEYQIDPANPTQVVVCPQCERDFNPAVVTIRAKRARGDKSRNRREFTIRTIDSSGHERMIEFVRRGYADFELRSKDIAVFIFIEGQLYVVQNLTTNQYMLIKKYFKAKPITLSTLIAFALIIVVPVIAILLALSLFHAPR